MELTQRLECTQELYPNNSEKAHPEQIGFLGICGTKYPLKKGPNKIGRDPATCNIILNFNSISRQHAVINILNSQEFMLMDLDSANKTKLSDKTLDAYIPHPLKNGDMVQFGQIFGVFRLLEEDNDLPMTQALDIPETPVQKKHVSKLNSVHGTTIPESPDVSDRDDSFIAPSQPKPKNVFKSTGNNFIKSSGKTISIKPVGTNKIDNVYWSSSKKSDSFSMQSNTSNIDIHLLSDSNTSNPPNIHELETQVPFKDNDSTDSIYNANTQVIENVGNPISPTIHNAETQIPTYLPQVCKIQDQHDVHFNFTTDNKENDNNIYNAETQVESKNLIPSKNNTSDLTSNSLSNEKTKNDDNLSDEEILFDDIDTPFEENFESQALIPAEFDVINNDNHEVVEDIQQTQEITFKRAKTRVCRIKSDSSTDCEDIDIVMTQKVPGIDDDTTDCENEPDVTKSTKNKDKMVVIDEDVTDCEDKVEENDLLSPNNKINIKKGDEKIVIDDDITDCEDNVDENHLIPPNKHKKIDEMDTQIIEIDGENVEDIPTQIIEEINDSKEKEACFEDLPTQIIEEEQEKDLCFEEQLTQKIYSEEIVPAFKIPKPSPKQKKKNNPEFKIVNQIIKSDIKKSNDDIDDELYYAATQEIFNDLCSQREFSQEIVKIPKISKDGDSSKVSVTEKIALNSFGKDTSDDIDIEEKIDNFVNSLSSSQIMDVVGAIKSPRKSSEPKATVKNVNPDTFSKLRNYNETKKSSPSSKDGDSLNKSSESKSENSIRSPIVMRNRKEPTKTRTELNEKVELLPTRVITRVRKPTSKMRNCDEGIKNLCDSIYSSKIKADKKSDKDFREAAENSTRGNKEKSSSKRKKKSDQYDGKGDKKYSKTNKQETKGETKKSEKETRQSRNSRKNDKPEESNSKSSNEKVQKDILSYLNNTDRRTRSRSNQKSDANEIQELRKKDKLPLSTKDNVVEEKSHRSQNKATEKRESNEKEVRRSKRQVTQKLDENLRNDKISKASKSSKGHHDQSVIYNLSSESTADSTHKLKRSATENFEVPSTKKSKTDSNSKNISVRSITPRKVKTHYVLFTAFPCEEVKIKLEKLGAIIVTDVIQCTVVLTIQIKRTFKLLCAVGLGKPIVGPSWVQACVDTNIIVDPWQYLIRDDETERRFQFNLERSLAAHRNFLKGYNISSTPSVIPNAQEMKLIVECSGGTWKDGGPNWICVSSLADKKFWPALKKKGAVIVSTEFILAGVLRQRVEIDKNKLY